MAESGFAPPAVGDIAGRRAMWEPITGAASTAQPIPADVTTSEHYATAGDGAHIKMRRYVKDGVAPGPGCSSAAAGSIVGDIDLFDGPVSRYVSASPRLVPVGHQPPQRHIVGPGNKVGEACHAGSGPTVRRRRGPMTLVRRSVVVPAASSETR